MNKFCEMLALTFILLSQSAFAFDQRHSDLAAVLNKFVAVKGLQSEVRYAELKKQRASLDGYLKSLEQVSKSEFESMSREQRLAFLINAYNALTLKLVTEHYPVKSIKDIGGLFSNPWKLQFFKLFGERHSLDDIEHKMIRPVFNEPRIHFALVCASRGCPRLLNSPYIADALETQLSEAQKTFLSDKTKNDYDPSSHTFSVSSIFKWYGDDFAKEFGSVRQFLAAKIPLQNPLSKEQAEKARIDFRDYDWSLNDARDNLQSR